MKLTKESNGHYKNMVQQPDITKNNQNWFLGYSYLFGTMVGQLRHSGN